MQLDAFRDFQPRARRTDPASSHEAATRVDGRGLAALVLAELAKGEGTTHDLALRLSLSLVTISPRMAPLQRKGLVIAAGKRGGRTIWRLA